LALRGKYRLLVPSLWLFETANLLPRSFPLKAHDLLEALMDFGFEEITPNPSWMETAISLCKRHKVTFYDAAYHAAAIVEKGTFVTADVRYAKKAHASGFISELSRWKS